MTPPFNDAGFVRMPEGEFEAMLAQAANEVAAFPEDPVLIDWMADYAVLRDQVRVCRT